MQKQDMLINYVPGEECRIAIVENGKLDELYAERTSAGLHVNNIYRGRVTNVEPSIQAAFIDFGVQQNGFLHITDLHPRYFPKGVAEDTERVGRKTPRKERPPIQECLRRGQEILVQVLKEGIGTKGPTLTSYLSIPGRFLVMMPNMERLGVSRKIEDPEKRKVARKILDDLDPPDGFGFIVRTAGMDQTKTELKRDLAYLLRLWKDIESRMKSGRGPRELYAESDLIIRTLRDSLPPQVNRIVIDDRIAALRAKQFLRIAMPRTQKKIIHYDGSVPLFHAFNVESQIDLIHARTVPLECGGSIVFDSAEAMVAVDVNSGNFRNNTDAEQTAYLTNLQAVDEIARQLRLRDLGGLIVLDLIDMYIARHRREVESKFREAMRKDNARSKVLRISELGLMQLTRQRMRPSLKKSLYDECTTCRGTGHVQSAESVVLDIMRRLALLLFNDRVLRATLTVHTDVAAMLLNRRRDSLVNIEKRAGKPLTVKISSSISPDAILLQGFDENNLPIEVEELPRMRKPQFSREHEISVKDLDELDDLLEDAEQEAAAEIPVEDDTTGESRKRRRRRRRRRRSGDDSSEQNQDQAARDSDDSSDSASRPENESRAHNRDAKTRKNTQKRNVSRQKDSEKRQKSSPKDDFDTPKTPSSDQNQHESDTSDTEKSASQRRGRRRRGGRTRSSSSDSTTSQPSAEQPDKSADSNDSNSRVSRGYESTSGDSSASESANGNTKSEDKTSSKSSSSRSRSSSSRSRSSRPSSSKSRSSSNSSDTKNADSSSKSQDSDKSDQKPRPSESSGSDSKPRRTRRSSSSSKSSASSKNADSSSKSKNSDSKSEKSDSDSSSSTQKRTTRRRSTKSTPSKPQTPENKEDTSKDSGPRAAETHD